MALCAVWSGIHYDPLVAVKSPDDSTADEKVRLPACASSTVMFWQKFFLANDDKAERIIVEFAIDENKVL